MGRNGLGFPGGGATGLGVVPSSVKPVGPGSWLENPAHSLRDSIAHRSGTPEPSGHMQGGLCAVMVSFSGFVEVIVIVLPGPGGELSSLRMALIPPCCVPCQQCIRNRCEQPRALVQW